MGYGLSFTQTRDLTTSEWDELCIIVYRVTEMFVEEVVRKGGKCVGFDWDVDDETIQVYDAGERGFVDSLRINRQPIQNKSDGAIMARKITRRVQDMARCHNQGPGGKYDHEGQHVAAFFREWCTGPEATPWFRQAVSLKSAMAETLAQAIVTSLYVRFPSERLW